MPPDFQRRSSRGPHSQGTENGGMADRSFSQVGGNAARQDQLRAAQQVTGPMGRMFNRICGRAEAEASPDGVSFGRDQLIAYLDKSLDLAKDCLLYTSDAADE